MHVNKTVSLLIVLVSTAAFISTVHAGLVTSVFDSSWTVISSEEDIGDTIVTGAVLPGSGGQAFDAEYLLAKQENGYLYIGLQTGFDVNDDGQQTYGSSSRIYYAGDIALSFDGTANSGSWEYAIDLGFESQGYTTDIIGTHTAGIYKVDNWSNDVYYGVSNPYSMIDFIGSRVDFVSSGSGFDELSSWAWVAFDLNDLNLGYNPNDVDVHWTMSCGNDAVDGSYSVPEPMTISLLGLGLLSLGFMRKRKS
jgi:hypothetical protein